MPYDDTTYAVAPARAGAVAGPTFAMLELPLGGGPIRAAAPVTDPAVAQTVANSPRTVDNGHCRCSS